MAEQSGTKPHSEVPTRIAGYDVLRVLGHGAASTLYAVKDTQGQVFTLKRVVRQDAKADRYFAQAEQEYEVCRKLKHPHLRRSYDLVRIRRMFRTVEICVVLEMVDGATLQSLATLSLERMCQTFVQVTVGLEAMHDAGWVHADIKPLNLLLTKQFQAKIIDFGQSCKAGTVKERIQGTPDYIAPEQVAQREITPATDVFNLGASMYWMLTGKNLPTRLGGVPGQMERVKGNLAPMAAPHEINPKVPPALSALVMECVREDPAERPQTMADVRERIEMAIAQMDRREAPGDSPALVWEDSGSLPEISLD